MKTIQQEKIDNYISELKEKCTEYSSGKIAGLIHAKKIYESELIPVMDQMRKALLDAKLMLEHQQLDWTDTYKEIKAVLENEPVENTDKILDGSLTGDDARDVIVQQWLKLTEELFKKIK